MARGGYKKGRSNQLVVDLVLQHLAGIGVYIKLIFGVPPHLELHFVDIVPIIPVEFDLLLPNRDRRETDVRPARDRAMERALAAVITVDPLL